MAVKWSFSADQCFRRCQRQYLFRNIIAWPHARDLLRREAYILKQVKTVEVWRGLVVHKGIERFVVPRLEAQEPIDWESVIRNTKTLAHRQLRFSAEKRYREDGVTKTAVGDDYCALLPHECGQTITAEEMEGVCSTIERSFRNLSAMSELWRYVESRNRYWAEFPFRVAYAGAQIEVRLDLVFFRAFGKPTIIDWKVHESMSGNNTHLQMVLYAWAMCRHRGWSVQRAEDVELLEVQLLTPEVVRHQSSDGAFEELEDAIFRRLDGMQSLCGSGQFRDQDIDDYAFANNPNSCSSCAFRSLCADISGKEPFASEASVSAPLQGVLF